MGKLLGSDAQAFGSNFNDWTSTPSHPVGTRAVLDGREYRYVRAGAADLVAGNVIQAPAQVTTHDQLTPTAASIGAERITVTLDATNAATADQYAGGLAIIDTTPGLGIHLPIIGHPAAAAAATLELTLGAPLSVALTSSSRVTLCPNPYRGVIQTPVTTLTGAAVGVAIAPITATYYGWIQTKGPAGVLVAGTPGVGLAVVVPATAAGAVVIDGAASATQVVGAMMVTGVDGKVLPVLINFP
jgi:hypothetical protein